MPFSVSHTSDHFAAIKKIATQMIKDGLAYVDPSPQEEQQKGRYEKTNSRFRDAPVKENLRLWEEARSPRPPKALRSFFGGRRVLSAV